VLRSKVKVFIFQEAVHENDEFAHAGSESDQGFFTGGAEPEVKSFENAVMTDGAHGGHVKGSAHSDSSATDMTCAAMISAIPVIWCQARQRGSSLVGDLAQLGHLGQDGGGDHGTDSRNGIESLGFVG